ncbi:MAG: response regulator [Candidatus Accumulibacter sp.]|jgi:putative two-component system response regulator|nr:response regulator [Accumulibacter sp.]
MSAVRLSVVIVDDSDINLMLFKNLVARCGDIEPLTFKHSIAGLEWCKAHGADIVVVDYMMPAPDGIEFIQRFRQLPEMGDIPVVMVTANNLVEVRYKALQAGATDFLTKPVDKNEFIARIRNMAALRRSQKLLADRAALLASEVAAATKMIAAREREIIFCLAKAAEYRDPETGAHIMRMAHYSRLIAAGLKLPVQEQELIFEAAPMHDLGKVGTRDEILLKPGRLTEDEFEIMKAHATIGYQILLGSSSPKLQAAAVIACSHHEKFDGSGYPKGLAGNDIPLYGRIVALADVFDALTSCRPYKKAWDLSRAAAYIREQSGSHFDPACVKAFFEAWDQVLAIRENYGDKEE